MFIYQDGKLYARDGDKLVGVNISSDSITVVEGTNAKLGKQYVSLTKREVLLKFNIVGGETYTFPVPTKEVVADGPTKSTKRTTRKSKSE